MTAALGIVLNPIDRTQQYFGGGETDFMVRKQLDTTTEGHTDDITALTINQERTVVATGQNGLQPLVFIWDAVTAQGLAQIKLPKGTRSVSALAFSRESTYLAICDLHNDHNVYVYSISKDVNTGSLKTAIV